ncbi:hypothetical protein [Limimaricola cinnabarinus]|uniref:hypothetical protein n=1 Tax=Limimaricola cinnabarinus TaxID=1125964 RepID=UPI0004023B7C
METIILFAPLVGALIAGFGWRLISEAGAQWVATSLVGLACLLSWIVFLGFDGQMEQIQILRWIESGSLATDWAIRLDRLTAIMLIVITTVSFLVHLYSFGYMAHDETSAQAKAIARAFSPICRSSPSQCCRWSPPTTSCRCSSAGKGWASPPTCSSDFTTASRRPTPPR